MYTQYVMFDVALENTDRAIVRRVVVLFDPHNLCASLENFDANMRNSSRVNTQESARSNRSAALSLM